MAVTVPVFVDETGREHALGPLELALVHALLDAAARMRRHASYRLELDVKHASVVVHYRTHGGTYTYGGLIKQQETA